MQSDFTSTTGVDGSIFVTSSQDTEDSATVTEDVAHSLVESLSKVKLPHITSDEQSDLFTIIKCIGGVEKHLTSIDGPATRFVFGLLWRNGQQHQGLLNQGNTNWGEILWAYESGSQDILVDFVSRQSRGKMLWRHACESGLFLWLTDIAAVVSTPFTKKFKFNRGVHSELNSKLLLATNTTRPMSEIPLTAVSSISRCVRRVFCSVSGEWQGGTKSRHQPRGSSKTTSQIPNGRQRL